MKKRPICKKCGIYPCTSKGYYASGERKWCNKCSGCKKGRKGSNARARHLKDKCGNCGFVPIHEIQLQVDHVDGNRRNNHPSNFQTLCANCHTLKTYVSRDYLTGSRREPPYTWDVKNRGWKDNPLYESEDSIVEASCDSQIDMFLH